MKIFNWQEYNVHFSLNKWLKHWHFFIFTLWLSTFVIFYQATKLFIIHFSSHSNEIWKKCLPFFTSSQMQDLQQLVDWSIRWFIDRSIGRKDHCPLCSSRTNSQNIFSSKNGREGCFQPLKYGYFLIFFVLYHMVLNVCVFQAKMSDNFAELGWTFFTIFSHYIDQTIYRLTDDKNNLYLQP